MPTALKTQVGRALGSAAARRLLAQDQIPGVVYGHGMAPVAVSVDRKDLRV
ncbi:MAG: 50S ribosomal protein L25, partial [Actinobacteria bacterium]|nr:50S ribosomal protein L25 [Actinomycetota bacterium]